MSKYQYLLGLVWVLFVFLISGSNIVVAQTDVESVEQVRTYISKNWDGTTVELTEARKNLIPLPHPYSVPTVKGETAFKALFYWDTYFTNLGLLRDGKFDQAQHNVDNILYLVEKYGKMPNSSSRGLLNRSQPPYLSMMVADVFAYSKDTTWLRSAVETLKKEYNFWMTKRLAPNGLNRYSSSATDRQKKMMAKLWASRSGDPEAIDGMSDEDLITLGAHVIAEAESGWDFNPRFDNRCEDFNPIDLNSNLYLYERNFVKFCHILKNETEAMQWEEKAAKRKDLLYQYCLDPDANLFSDYDFENGELSDFVSAAQFSVLFSGLADASQARAVVRTLKLLETPFGIRTCAAGERNFVYQWDNPNGWPPLHYIVVKGLDTYGYHEAAQRIGQKYVNTVCSNFHKTGHLWEKYNVEEGSVNTVNEYSMPKFLGWTAGVFIAISDMLEN